MRSYKVHQKKYSAMVGAYWIRLWNRTVNYLTPLPGTNTTLNQNMYHLFKRLCHDVAKTLFLRQRRACFCLQFHIHVRHNNNVLSALHDFLPNMFMYLYRSGSAEPNLDGLIVTAEELVDALRCTDAISWGPGRIRKSQLKQNSNNGIYDFKILWQCLFY